MKALNDILGELTILRRTLHHNPEISGREIRTGELVLQFCSRFEPSRIIRKIGRTGFALVFDSGHPGKTLMFRAELDAVSIEEDIEVSYISSKKTLSHKCGHDGHMTILCGLAYLLQQHPVRKGRVILLFQPAEEVGRGALAVANDPKFRELRPDYIFAIHNLPGYPRHSVIVKDGTFSVASEGVLITLKGSTSHAAYPEQGISPLPAIIELVRKLPQLTHTKHLYSKFVQVAVTYIRVGRFGFGTMPGIAELAMTLRGEEQSDLEHLRLEMKRMVARIAAKYYLEEHFRHYEPFIASVNDLSAVEAVRKVAQRHQFRIVELENPCRWSEDFGQFTKRYRGAMFGLGAGENHSDLHTWYYDFPDEILETGIKMFWGLTQDILND